jgi:protein-L-isoaspartate(D-aspartate) O-methyltransferase
MGLQVEEQGGSDLTSGLPSGAPYDIILIDGAVEFVPDEIIKQLRDGGRLATCLLESGVQRLVIGRRSGDGFGFNSIADGSAGRLPGFEKPRAFTF